MKKRRSNGGWGKIQRRLPFTTKCLKNDAKPAERREALCGKGDIYYEMGAADPQNYEQAIEFYEQLADEPGVPAHWRNQAEFKKGKALEKLNDKEGALTTYYGVIEEGARPDVQHEFFWFYKAGLQRRASSRGSERLEIRGCGLSKTGRGRGHAKR